MKYSLTKPCDECPFLRTSGFTFESLLEHAVGEFPCHKACDLDEDETAFVERKNGKTPHCAGALIFLEKRNKPHQMMRITERLGEYDASKLDMSANVGGTRDDYRRETKEERRRRTMLLVESGPYKGYRIRTARKPGRCDNFRRGCTVIIERGHRYVEGDGHPTTGPLGLARERLCLACGGVNEKDTENQNMKMCEHCRKGDDPTLGPLVNMSAPGISGLYHQSCFERVFGASAPDLRLAADTVRGAALIELLQEAAKEKTSVTAYRRVQNAMKRLGLQSQTDRVYEYLGYHSKGQPVKWLAEKLKEKHGAQRHRP
jgi:hypothetical protein